MCEVKIWKTKKKFIERLKQIQAYFLEILNLNQFAKTAHIKIIKICLLEQHYIAERFSPESPSTISIMGRDSVELAKRAKYKPPAMRVRNILKQLCTYKGVDIFYKHILIGRNFL